MKISGFSTVRICIATLTTVNLFPNIYTQTGVLQTVVTCGVPLSSNPSLDLFKVLVIHWFKSTVLSPIDGKEHEIQFWPMGQKEMSEDFQ